jgi:hypothetical protein
VASVVVVKSRDFVAWSFVAMHSYLQLVSLFGCYTDTTTMVSIKLIAVIAMMTAAMFDGILLLSNDIRCVVSENEQGAISVFIFGCAPLHLLPPLPPVDDGIDLIDFRTYESKCFINRVKMWWTGTYSPSLCVIIIIIIENNEVYIYYYFITTMNSEFTLALFDAVLLGRPGSFG